MVPEFGVGKGKVFPAERAGSLLNPLRRLVQPPSRVANRLLVAPGSRVLEVGCGPGYFSGALARAVPTDPLVMFDLQFAMLERARLRTPVGAVALQGDAAALPLKSRSIEAVVVVLMLGEVGDRDRFLEEVRRVLCPAGIALFAESRRDSDFVRLGQLRLIVEPHGFALLERRGPPWEYTARFQAC